jgi:glycosyltransferase involved in cell wall biosynthesis
MRRLLHDAGLRAHLIAAGRARAGAFTWDRCARETLAIYRGLVRR